MSKPNLSWLYYTEYYEGLDFSFINENVSLFKSFKTNDTRLKDASLEKINDIKKGNESKLKEKENILTNYSLKTLIIKTLPPEIAPHTFELDIAYPGLITGIGQIHETDHEGELKLGCFFDYTTGLPCINGASIKGKIRSAFPNFTSDEVSNIKRDLSIYKIQNSVNELLQTKFNKAVYIYRLLNNLNEHTDIQNINDFDITTVDHVHSVEMEMFEGKEKNESRRGAYQRDEFFNCFLSPSNDQKTPILAKDFITPHGDNVLRNPIPIAFIKLNSGLKMKFYFRFIDSTINSNVKKELVNKILIDLGIGAKTNVGYGNFKKAMNEIPFLESNTRSESPRSREYAKETEEHIPEFFYKYLIKNKVYLGKIINVSLRSVDILVYVEKRSFTINRQLHKIIGQPIINCDVEIRINQNYDFNKLNCKVIVK